MKFVVAAILSLSLLLTGCVSTALNSGVTNFVQQDFVAAGKVLDASKDLLAPGDPWKPCVDAMAAGILKLQQGPGLKVEGGGLITEAARLHVLDSLVQNIPEPVKASCGAVLFDLMLRAGRRAPGL